MPQISAHHGSRYSGQSCRVYHPIESLQGVEGPFCESLGGVFTSYLVSCEEFRAVSRYHPLKIPSRCDKHPESMAPTAPWVGKLYAKLIRAVAASMASTTPTRSVMLYAANSKTVQSFSEEP